MEGLPLFSEAMTLRFSTAFAALAKKLFTNRNLTETGRCVPCTAYSLRWRRNEETSGQAGGRAGKNLRGRRGGTKIPKPRPNHPRYPKFICLHVSKTFATMSAGSTFCSSARETHLPKMLQATFNMRHLFS